MKMNRHEYRAGLLACYAAAQAIAQHDLPAMLEAADRAEAMGPVLDPTLYRDKAGAMHEDRKVISAAMELHRVGKEMLR